MADEVDFSTWTHGRQVRGRRDEAIKSRNPLVPGGEASIPKSPEVDLAAFTPIETTSIEMLAAEGVDIAQRQAQSTQAFHAHLLALVGTRLPPPAPLPKDPLGVETALRVASILAESRDPQTRMAADALRRRSQ